MRLSDLRELVTIERNVQATDFEHLQGWSAIGHAWVSIQPSDTRESLAANETVGTVTHLITMRWRDDVSIRDRLRQVDVKYGIVGQYDPNGRRQWLVCKCIEEQQ